MSSHSELQQIETIENSTKFLSIGV